MVLPGFLEGLHVTEEVLGVIEEVQAFVKWFWWVFIGGSSCY